MDSTTLHEHSFVSISVIPVDVRVADDGEIEYAEAPERQLDNAPEQVCQLCWVPLSKAALEGSPCPGPKIPDTIASLTEE